MDYMKVFIAGVATMTSLSLATASYAEGPACNSFGEVDKMGNGEGLILCVVKGNNGWGNGDDDAPGGSLENNNAENYEGGDPYATDTDGMDQAPGNSGSNGNG